MWMVERAPCFLKSCPSASPWRWPRWPRSSILPLSCSPARWPRPAASVLRDLVAEAFYGATPLRTPIEVTALTDDAVLLGALDAGLRAVRDSLIDSLRHALAPA